MGVILGADRHSQSLSQLLGATLLNCFQRLLKLHSDSMHK